MARAAVRYTFRLLIYHGNFTVRAYTSWMKTLVPITIIFFQKSWPHYKPVEGARCRGPSAERVYDVQFSEGAAILITAVLRSIVGVKQQINTVKA